MKQGKCLMVSELALQIQTNFRGGFELIFLVNILGEKKENKEFEDFWKHENILN